MEAQAPYKSIEGLMATEAFMASRTKNSFVLESYFSFLGPLFTKVWFDLDPNLPNLAGKIHISANPCWRVHTCPVDRCTRVGTVTRNVSPILVSTSQDTTDDGQTWSLHICLGQTGLWLAKYSSRRWRRMMICTLFCHYCHLMIILSNAGASWGGVNTTGGCRHSSIFVISDVCSHPQTLTLQFTHLHQHNQWKVHIFNCFMSVSNLNLIGCLDQYHTSTRSFVLTNIILCL